MVKVEVGLIVDFVLCDSITMVCIDLLCSNKTLLQQLTIESI